MCALRKACQNTFEFLPVVQDGGKSFWKMLWPLLNICAVEGLREIVMMWYNLTQKSRTTFSAFSIACTNNKEKLGFTEILLQENSMKSGILKGLYKYSLADSIWEVELTVLISIAGRHSCEL